MSQVWARQWLTVAPAAALIAYWRVPLLWFHNDDFAWLNLAASVRDWHTLWHAMFTPYAQGTVRVISERLYFLAFYRFFGLNAAAYHIWALGT